MNWFLVKITYRIICGDGTHTPQFDEQLRLISAFDKEAALLKADEIGNAEADSFLNNSNQPVQWQFIAISEIYRLSEWVDGAELYSSVKEVDHAESYINMLQAKAASLDQQSRHLLNLV